MAWEQLAINKPHLVYIILGAFTSLFMLCSSVIKERLYIGEATVATLCGIIFGPHAANLIDPGTWGNTDQITLEFSRIVLVVQCFAVGVELPKAYMERHWRSVLFLLVPVMTFGWLITSLFIWAFFSAHINWLDSLCIAACVTATDPVLASSVVGKGKFAKRVPKHLRDLLSAESGCNDGMAFPFIYLALYIIRYYGHPSEVAQHWFCNTILYECLFGAIYGFTIGYIARRLIRMAHEHDLIDRESFLVYYFVLALFCAGSGSLLGMDDLLVGFACGVGFSNDGWFTHETEESHVSNVIDLLINLAFFVYFGTIIPWEQYNAGILGLDVWKLVVIGILVLLFRRIPIMMALKPFIPDIKTWREALFAGHFGPIGVGALFVAILARAELETEETTPLDTLPDDPNFPHLNIIELIWPITTFLVLCSILVHGSSIAVFTLGKHINTLTLTMSYTKGQEDQSWMDRLPRIQSRTKSQMSSIKDDSDVDEEKRMGPSDFAPGTFLKRMRPDEKGASSRSSSRARHRSRHSRNWENGKGPGGHVSESAIYPASRDPEKQSESRSDSDTLAAKGGSGDSPSKPGSNDVSPPESQPQSPGEIFEEGQDTVYEDEDGNVLAVESPNEKNQKRRESDEIAEGERLMREQSGKHSDEGQNKHASDASSEDESVKDKKEAGSGGQWRQGLQRLTSKYMRGDGERRTSTSEPKETRGPARAYQYGNTIIVEDEDGEVIKKYDIPAPDRKQSVADPERSIQRVGRMAKMLGIGGGGGGGGGGGSSSGANENENVEAGAPGPSSSEKEASRPEARRMFSNLQPVSQDDSLSKDDGLRFTLATGGRRMSTAEFIDHIQSVDPRTRAQIVEESNAPEPVKREARKDAREQAAALKRNNSTSKVPVVPEHPGESDANVQNAEDGGLKLVDSNNQDVPFHDISSQLKARSTKGNESAAERRRRAHMQASTAADEDSEDDGTERQPPRRRHQGAVSPDIERQESDVMETPAERRRRLDALGKKNDSDSERESKKPAASRQGIRFAETTRPGPSSGDDAGAGKRLSSLRWGKDRRDR